MSRYLMGILLHWRVRVTKEVLLPRFHLYRYWGCKRDQKLTRLAINIEDLCLMSNLVTQFLLLQLSGPFRQVAGALMSK